MIKYAGLISHFTRTEIDQLFDASTARARTMYYTLLAAPRSKEYARILPVISKRLGTAVVRNRLRRQIKAIFYQEKIYLTSAYDFVLIARQPITTLPFDQLKAQLCAHFSNKS